jgi:cytidylate kinase
MGTVKDVSESDSFVTGTEAEDDPQADRKIDRKSRKIRKHRNVYKS